LIIGLTGAYIDRYLEGRAEFKVDINCITVGVCSSSLIPPPPPPRPRPLNSTPTTPIYTDTSPSPRLRDVGSSNNTAAPSEARTQARLPLPFPKGCGRPIITRRRIWVGRNKRWHPGHPGHRRRRREWEALRMRNETSHDTLWFVFVARWRSLGGKNTRRGAGGGLPRSTSRERTTTRVVVRSRLLLSYSRRSLSLSPTSTCQTPTPTY